MSLRRYNPYYRWLFPWLLDRVSGAVADERSELLRQAQGLVLEIGAGTGSSFHCYGDAMDRLIALEPDIAVMQLARQQLAKLPSDMQAKTALLLADAQSIPLADNSVDTLVSFLVLCSVPQPEQALAEMHRVLKEEGQLLFFEHVLADDPAIQRWQQRLNPLWHRCAGGCQLNRQTAELIQQAGFSLQDYERYKHHAFPRLVGQLVSGRAVKGRA
ncbi:class I SAM-dependent methyltransferase [Amphritea sp. 1_MG-2023]|uniref:class I SAM-dependent methyltransferase n=1 Tax=Amphritea sp. 1_MG-2023 TaxID=3062670 RepID=UPI0026E1DF81|nr:class I SAM-dependent methyltransferase [Amphritea sp. 1_MG-2023]MDO6562837.1 class I SAM-dependent methyltransferase [Amphritea sp. 1_MG-2023]